MSKQVIRKPWIAAVMSLLLPGYGQLYNGNVNKGLMLFMLFAFCSIPLPAFIALYMPSVLMLLMLLLGLIATLGLWLYGIIEAYKTAKKTPQVTLQAWQMPAIYLAIFLAAMVFILPGMTNFIREHQVESFRIPSNSMKPTIMRGDYLFADKRYNCPQCKQHIQRGDIAILVYPNNRTQYYIKRIIGLPGDRIRIENQTVYINDKAITTREQTGNLAHTETIQYSEITEAAQYHVQWQPNDRRGIAELIVPQGEVFVLGDNRSAAKDSRYFGTVPLQDVVGKVRQIWFSWGDDGVRWERLGKIFPYQ